MREYTCIIIDDEAKAIEVLADTIKELYANIRIAGVYSNWKDALQAMRKKDYDILFLDISMPEKSGFDLLGFVPHINAEIIFVTAHQEYALDAFNYPATAYVLKPVEDLALDKAMQKALAKIDSRKAGMQTHRIAVPDNQGVYYFDENDIIYLEAKIKHTLVKTKNKAFISTQAFGIFKDMLGRYPFFQVHRSFIVNVNYVLRYERTGILTMSEGQTIPVSKHIREDFLKLLGKQI
ncbi:MAG TPA: LytTR family DNA-binding domain-containing protein [Flavipsychrobacter sp.]|nr:LytTR family DNA-binding domain-containing protein [Flavipsychrobacter sp.]